jgi:hypothetical protein
LRKFLPQAKYFVPQILLERSKPAMAGLSLCALILPIPSAKPKSQLCTSSTEVGLAHLSRDLTQGIYCDTQAHLQCLGTSVRCAQAPCGMGVEVQRQGEELQLDVIRPNKPMLGVPDFPSRSFFSLFFFFRGVSNSFSVAESVQQDQ